MRLPPAALPSLALLLAGCAPALVSPGGERHYQHFGGLELSAGIESDPTGVYAAVDIMNPGSEPFPLAYSGECELALLVLPPRGPAPRWDSSRWLTGQGDPCTPVPRELTIPPGTLARIVLPAVDAPQILGDSIPAGRYTAAVRVRLLQPRDTVFVLRAGDVQLRR